MPIAHARDSHWFPRCSRQAPSSASMRSSVGCPVRISTTVMDGGKRDMRSCSHTMECSRLPRSQRTFTSRRSGTRQAASTSTLRQSFRQYAFCFDNRPHPPDGDEPTRNPARITSLKQPLSRADKFIAFNFTRDSGRKAHKEGKAPTKEEAHLTEEDEVPANTNTPRTSNSSFSRF